MNEQQTTPSGRLAGKLILVTAAASGMGRETALTFAAEGARVIATDIDEKGLASLTQEGIEPVRLDVRDTESIRSVVAGRTFDAVFNCAGIVHPGTILETTDEQWQLAFEINVRGMANVIRETLPAMLERGAGSIVNMASVVSSVVGAPNRAIYGTTKAAVIGLTKSVAKDFIKQGIRCNAVCPGTVDTPSLRQRLEATGDYEAALAEFRARQPMGVIAEAADIVPLITYLASDESRFVTGQAFSIDGGWSA